MYQKQVKMSVNDCHLVDRSRTFSESSILMCSTADWRVAVRRQYIKFFNCFPFHRPRGFAQEVHRGLVSRLQWTLNLIQTQLNFPKDVLKSLLHICILKLIWQTSRKQLLQLSACSLRQQRQGLLTLACYDITTTKREFVDKLPAMWNWLWLIWGRFTSRATADVCCCCK